MYLGKQTVTITLADKYVLRGVHEIEIKKSVHQIIQTAKVELPLSVVMRNNDLLQRIKLADKIKEGDSIKLQFGYDGNNITEFEGFIRRTNYVTPMVLECEDELYLLRKCYYKKSFKKCSLKDIVAYVLKGLNETFGVQYELYDKMPEFEFSNFLMKECTGIDVLNELKEKYGLSSYLTVINGKKTLYVGLLYGIDKGNVKYGFNKNTINTGDLKYSGGEPKKYMVKAINFNRDGTKTTVEFGDKGGDNVTKYFYGNHTTEDLKHLANAELQKYGVLGYKGSFDCFLKPYAEPGMNAELNDLQFPDRKGNYYAGTVTTTFGMGGGRRKVEVDFKTST